MFTRIEYGQLFKMLEIYSFLKSRKHIHKKKKKNVHQLIIAKRKGTKN